MGYEVSRWTSPGIGIGIGKAAKDCNLSGILKAEGYAPHFQAI